MKFFGDTGKKFLFVHIPKTGGSSIKAIINESVSMDNWQRDGEYITTTLNTHIGFTRSDCSEFEGFFKFAMVRHPYDWIMSTYNFGKNKDKFYKEVCSHNNFAQPDIDMPFDDWLNTVSSYNQSDWFCDGSEILIDKVYKLENFTSSVDDICSRIGIQKPKETFHFKDSKKFNMDEVKSLTEDQKKKIQRICSRDFELLGYNI